MKKKKKICSRLVSGFSSCASPVQFECSEIREFERFNRAIEPLDHYMVLTNVPEKLEEAIVL